MPRVRHDGSRGRHLSSAQRRVTGRFLPSDLRWLYPSRERLALPAPLSSGLPNSPHTAVHNAASTHVPVASMAGPAPSPPSKDMAAPCVTSAWLAHLQSAHSASLIPAARDQHGGHGGYAGSRGNSDGTVPIRKMVKEKLQLARKHFPNKCGENAHAHSGPQYTNASDLTSLPHNNLFHRTGGKQGPLMTWQPAWHHLPIMYIWALSPAYPPQHQGWQRSNMASFLASVCPASIWRLRTLSLAGDSGIRLGPLRLRGY